MGLKTTSAAAAAALIMSVLPVSADETGLAGIHEMRREGNRLCFSDHFHYGSASGATKKAAIAKAVDNWQQFTALEYGTSWGSWGKAGSKKIGCSGAGANWSCQIEGRACK